MYSLNRVTLLGHLGKDPEIRSTQDGREIANLTLATSKRYKAKNSDEIREITDWHKIAVFQKNLVEFCKKHLHKGSKVYVEGELKTRKWQDNTGADRYVTEVQIAAYSGTIILAERLPASGGTSSGSGDYGRESGGVSTTTYGDNRPEFVSEELDDEIPF